MLIAAFIVLLAASPALGGQVRPDQPVAPVQFGAAPASQTFVRTASDGTNFFAVWRTSTKSGALIVGSRISPRGETLDRPSVVVASGDSTLGYPDVVFAGDHFLVAYPAGGSVLVRRVSRDGGVASEPVVAGSGSLALLATNGKTVLLATSSNRMRMLAADGIPLGVEREIPNGGGGSFQAGSNGDRYLIAYTNGATGSRIGSLVLLGPNGDFLAGRPIPLAGALFPRTISVASNGSSFLVSMATNGPVACMVVDADGNAGVPRTLDSQSGGSIASTWSGVEYTLVWSRTLSTPTQVTGHDIVGVRVDSAGVSRDATPIPVDRSVRYGWAFASSWNGQDTIVIVSDDNGNYEDWHTTAAIFSSLAQIDGEPPSRRHVAIGSSAPEQAGGSIASNGTLSLVAWRESSGLDRAVARAAFIAAGGQLGAPIEIGDADPQSTTATASNGRDFLVAYFDAQYRLVARRVARDGILDSTPIVIDDYGTPTDALAVGWSGRAYVVMTAGYSSITISGVNTAGIVTVPRHGLATKDPANAPALRCGPSGCSATWHTLTPFPGYGEFLFEEKNSMALTDSTGAIQTSVLLTGRLEATSALAFPALDGYLFVYSYGKTMFAGRITSGGVVLDPPAIDGGVSIMTSETSFPLQPVAAVREGLYLVELSDETTGRLYWSHLQADPIPRATSIVDLQQNVTLPLTLAASARNTYLLYSACEENPQLLASRLFVRTIATPDPQPTIPRRRSVR
jgi:hypothetical protein